MGAAVQQIFKRVEKKYLMTNAQYEAFYEAIMPYMKADEYGKYTICNIYYDTDNYELIRTSLEKPVYKEKLRLRSYGIPEDEKNVFVEIKKKYDHVVYKRRITMKCADAVDYLQGNLHSDEQIGQEVEWFLKSYQPKPKVYLAYDRIALAGIDNSELRITFDTNLRWRDYDLDLRKGDYGDALISDEFILMEIKIPDTAPIWLGNALSSLGIFPISFSKYGICYKEHLAWQAVPKVEKSECLQSQSETYKNNSLKEDFINV